jgi:hypothetical protein
MTTATQLQAAMSDSAITTGLLEGLRNHFVKPDDPDPGAVCLTEVTSPNGTRRADLVHIGLWSSRGAGRIDVCEVKASRADWLRELKQPAKAEAWWPHSSTYSLVVPHESLVRDGELPPGWGLMVPGSRSRRFKVVVKPQERTPTLTVPLLVTVLKCTETTRKNAVAQETRRLYQKHRLEMDALRQQKTTAASPRTAARLELLDQIEKALGREIDRYPYGTDQISPAAAADALATVAAGSAAIERRTRLLEREQQHLRTLADQYRQAADTVGQILTTQEN